MTDLDKEDLEAFSTENGGMNYDNELLVRLSSLTKGRLLDRRVEIRKDILLASINTYDIGSSFDVKEVISKIRDKIKCILSEQDTITILDSLSDDGILESLGNLRFKLIRKIDLPDYGVVIQPVWDEFFECFLKKQYPRYDPHLHKMPRSF